MEKIDNMLPYHSWELLESMISTKPIPVIITSFILSVFSFLQIPTPQPSTIHSILELTQILSGVIGMLISMVTFWFVIVKPRLSNKKKKSKKP